jgi:hypothetical protein
MARIAASQTSFTAGGAWRSPPSQWLAAALKDYASFAMPTYIDALRAISPHQGAMADGP